MKKGICVAGHLCVDVIYPCETYPREGELTRVRDGITRKTGGLVNNTGMDLSRLDPDLPVTAAGCIGPDADGEFILSCLSKYSNIDCSMLQKTGGTGFTAVMTNETSASKTRTFFQYGGANTLFSQNSLDLKKIAEHADILHIGYLLLLPELDAEDPEYGTKMARLLHDAKEHGLLTSIDVVSETGSRTFRIVPPALRYTDYCIINELEAQSITGISLRTESGTLLRENLKPALESLKALGVSRWAVIHAPECGAGLDEAGAYTELPSLTLPNGYIKGTTGAGDAFCSGVLLGAERELAMEESLILGITAAAAALGNESATDGVGTAEKNRTLWDTLPHVFR